MIIVYAYIVGDLLHIGHLIHLKNAKRLGDKLIVGVLSEQAILEKKPKKPILSLEERMHLVRCLKCADLVVAQDEYSPLKNVMEIKPDILVESSSHKEQTANNFMKSIGGRVISLPYFPKQSSTKIKKRVKDESR